MKPRFESPVRWPSKAVENTRSTALEGHRTGHAPLYAGGLVGSINYMNNALPNGTQAQAGGQVFLVGAGPGDPRLITLRGVECLQTADVVLYDYLVNPQILSHARPDAHCICLGKHGRTRIWTQQEINDRLVQEARRGKTVVRLKSGDPTVFARAAEEIEAVTSAGLKFEIVPGVTAALAASSFGGVPATHRDLSSSVTLITGQENPAKSHETLDYQVLAKLPGTLIIYMGVTTAPQWTAGLLNAGKSPNTPVAIIRRCSFPDQSTIRCKLSEVTRRLEKPAKVRPPAVFVIGEVAGLPPLWNWFERKPLFGRRILITRPREQAEELARSFQALGAETWIQPAIEISDPADWKPVDETLGDLSRFDWIVFSSSNGVRYFFQRLLWTGRDIRALAGARLAAMGPGTAAALAGYHLRTDAQPEVFRAEEMVNLLAPQAGGTRFLLVRASRGREFLAEGLRSAGGHVEQIVVYTSSDVTSPRPEIAEQLTQGGFDWVIATSSAIARSLVRMFGDQLHKTRIASISPITTQTLQENGFTPAVEAVRHDMVGVIEAIRKFTPPVEK